MATIKIKCPNCSAVLTVMDDPANLTKNVRCPICKEKRPFADFKQVIAVAAEEKTELESNRPDDATMIIDKCKNMSLGFLLDENSRRKYSLSEGRNLIGRMPRNSAPLSDIAIDTDDMGFSRKHLVIEVTKYPDGSVRHIASNAENKNDTSINGHVLSGSDRMILHDGDVITTSVTVLSLHIE